MQKERTGPTGEAQYVFWEEDDFDITVNKAGRCFIRRKARWTRLAKGFDTLQECLSYLRRNRGVGPGIAKHRSIGD